MTFKKTLANNHTSPKDGQENRQNQNDDAKLKLMELYDISAEEAELVIKRLEKRVGEASNAKKSPSPNKNQQPIPKNTEEPNKNVLKKQDDYTITPLHANNKQNPEKTQEKQTPNVDELLNDLIPDYGNKVSVEVKGVNLTFDVEIDRIDTIKEYFIRTLKRNKRDKIKLKVLKDISFTIYKGEKVGIIGYNGAGKSTLLKVITGIYTPDSGSVKTYGNISPMLSLGAGFDQNYSGRKNIYLNGAVLGYNKKYLRKKEKEIIEFSELGKFIDFPIKNYSSGMLAKLGFSIATIVDPDILIIDEVLGVGDVKFRKKSSDKIKSLMGGKTTVILVSHSIPKIQELCDRAIWIDQGKVRQIGEVNEVCRNYLKDAKKATNKQLENIRLH